MKIITIFDIDNNSFLIKPDTALLRNNDPYYIPSFTNKVTARAYAAVKITRIAKGIDKQFAPRLWDALSVAVEFCAADVLEKCKAESRTWDIALSYDKSTAVSNDSVVVGKDMEFDIRRGDSVIFSERVYDISDVINHALAKVSHMVTLKIGDMVIVPLCSDELEVSIGDYITATCNDASLLDFDIK